MSTYGAISYQYKVLLKRTHESASNVVKCSMLSASNTIDSDKVHFNAQEVDFGSEPLSAVPRPDDSLLSDYSLCNFDVMDFSSVKPGSSSPAGDASGYCIPKDYPKKLGMDRELKLTCSKEPYVMAEYNKKDDIHFMGNVYEGHDKGSLNLSSNESPGKRRESTTISSLYPSNISSSSSYSYNSFDDNSPSPPFKQRSNPFKEENLSTKTNIINNSYSDIVLVNSSSATQSASSQQMDIFVGSSPRRYEAALAPKRSYDIPSYHPKLKGVKSQGQSSTEIDEVITAMKGTFNNAVQYIASLPGNSFDSTSSICFLGKLYNGKHFPDERMVKSESLEDQHGTFRDFLSDFQSRVWVTYRRGFLPLAGTSLTSDTGWGCMLRTGQMMLATALQIHCFGRDWRKTSKMDHVRFQELVRCFGETAEHPFSLQNLLKIGKDHLNKSYGEWYGPSTVAYVLRVCVDYARSIPQLNGMINISDFILFTATDCMVFKGDIIKTATLDSTKRWTKTLLLISVRMGADELNLSYRKPIQTFLLNESCIGIMGGRKRHSLYFTGFQGNKLIHYDPHTCQTALKMGKEFCTESYVCMKPRKMSFYKMDPSCTFAFFLQTRADLEELVELSESMGKHKIFELLDGTKDEYLAIVTDPSIRAFDHNESMFDEGVEFTDIGSLEGSDFEYLE